MARTVRFHAFGGPEVLQLDHVPLRDPGPGEVRIAVRAIGLNRVETIYRSGHFGPVNFPARIGYEAAGTIEALGGEVEGLAIGDRVAVLYGLSMEQYGTCAETILYPADRLVKLPKALSFTDAAASLMQYGTAYALVEVANVTAGDHIVITAASSSVGIAAIQIARAHGAVPIAVTRARAKTDALRALGAAHVVVSDEENVPARVHEITGGSGARIVFDAVGGQPLADLLSASANAGAIASEGVAIVYGLLGGPTMEVPLAPVMLANRTLRGWSADVLTRDPVRAAPLVRYIMAGLESGALRPVIARTFALEQVVEAYRYLESNQQVGKIVLTTGADP